MSVGMQFRNRSEDRIAPLSSRIEGSPTLSRKSCSLAIGKSASGGCCKKWARKKHKKIRKCHAKVTPKRYPYILVQKGRCDSTTPGSVDGASEEGGRAGKRLTAGQPPVRASVPTQDKNCCIRDSSAPAERGAARIYDYKEEKRRETRTETPAQLRSAVRERSPGSCRPIRCVCSVRVCQGAIQNWGANSYTLGSNSVMVGPLCNLRRSGRIRFPGFLWAVGPAALPCAGGLPPQRPPDTPPPARCGL